MPTARDFPFFDTSNQDAAEKLIYATDPAPLREILTAGGFQVHEMYSGKNRLPMMGALEPITRRMTHFTVSLPERWGFVRGFDEYGLPSEDVWHLLDGKGQFRGTMQLDSDGVPVAARIFCRYYLMDDAVQWSFAKLGIERPTLASECQWAVVVDYACVNREQPLHFPIVVHHALRWETPPPPRKPVSEVLKAATANIGVSMGREFERIRSGKPPDWHPIHRWLNEHYPDWRSPWAYWD